MKHCLPLLACAALACGCAAQPPQTPPSPATAARPPDVTPIEATGTYTHEPSHAMVPAEIAGFKRVSLFRRGADGQRITAGYAGGTPPRCPIAVTLFIDPSQEAGSVDKAYARAKAEVVHAYPSAAVEREESRDPPVPGRRALIRIEDRRMELAVMQQSKAWDVKYRAIFPAACTEEARAPLNEFLPGWAR